MALKQVKNKIIATKKTGQVTKAMEAVSAVKMRKSQERALSGRPYAKAALGILAKLGGLRADGVDRVTLAPAGAHKELLIIVTSDKGLAGAVNSAVLKKVDQLTNGREVEIIAVGRKAVEYARREDLPLHGEYINVSDSVTLNDVTAISRKVLELFESGEYRKVSVVYQNFISTFEQSPVVRQVLPLDTSALNEVMAGIKVKGEAVKDDATLEERDYIVEPSAEEVLLALVPQLINIMVYHALLENKASEHSARMVAMKNATDKSKEVVKSLTIKYNKARQAAITAEVSEITAGAEAMKN